MEILETQERKMNKNKEKKRELTHFLGHYQDLINSKSVLSAKQIHLFCHESINK